VPLALACVGQAAQEALPKLRELQATLGLAYLFISHDLRVVAAMSSSLMVMKEGKVVETGPAADIFKSPKTAYTRALFAAAFNLEASPEAVVAE
jgi:microcin C transport system ATP-binding protein